MNISYAARFQDRAAAAEYEAREYGTGSYASRIWDLQRPVLEKLAEVERRERRGELRLLDFACGTGRVLAALEPLVDVADGVDLSAEMVALARAKCRKSRLRVGDILAEPDLLQKSYDIIACFRFLLNVEPEMRRRVLRRLRGCLREPGGLFLVNVHGNSRSLRHPAILWRRWREHLQPTGAMLNEMSPGETRTLLRESGFHVVRELGFGMMPPTLYRTPLCRLAAAVDQFLAGDRWCRRWSIELLFVCRPI